MRTLLALSLLLVGCGDDDTTTDDCNVSLSAGSLGVAIFTEGVESTLELTLPVVTDGVVSVTTTVPPPIGTGAAIDMELIPGPGIARAPFTCVSASDAPVDARVVVERSTGTCMTTVPIECRAAAGECIPQSGAGTVSHTARANDCGQTDFTLPYQYVLIDGQLDVTRDDGTTATGALGADCSTSLTTDDGDVYTLQCSPTGCTGTLANIDGEGCETTFDVELTFDDDPPVEVPEIQLLDEDICGEERESARLGSETRYVALGGAGSAVVVAFDDGLSTRDASDVDVELASGALPVDAPADTRLAADAVIFGPGSANVFHLGPDLTTVARDPSTLGLPFTPTSTCFVAGEVLGTPLEDVRCVFGDDSQMAAGTCEVTADAFSMDVVATIDRAGPLDCTAVSGELGRVLANDGTLVDVAADGTVTEHAPPADSAYVSIHPTTDGVALRSNPEFGGGFRTRVDVATGFGASYQLRASIVRANQAGLMVGSLGSHIVIGTGRFDGDLYVIDLSDPANVLQVGFTPFGASPRAAACTDTGCFIVGEDELIDQDLSSCF